MDNNAIYVNPLTIFELDHESEKRKYINRNTNGENQVYNYRLINKLSLFMVRLCVALSLPGHVVCDALLLMPYDHFVSFATLC